MVLDSEKLMSDLMRSIALHGDEGHGGGFWCHCCGLPAVCVVYDECEPGKPVGPALAACGDCLCPVCCSAFHGDR
jgi:hypothetical protein